MTDLKELYRELLGSLNLEFDVDIQEDQMCCTIFTDNNDTAIEIEMPEDSDLLLLHRKIAELPVDPDLRTARILQTLALNGCQDKLCGSWFCIDPEGLNIHLMAGYPIRLISTTEFNNLLCNFISLGSTLEKEFDEEILEINSSSTLSTGISV